MKGRIHNIAGKTIYLAPAQSACFGCMNAACKSRPQLVVAENHRNLDLTLGQLVEIEIPSKQLLQQAAAVLLPPIAGFIAGFLLIRALFPFSSDGARAAAGVVFLFAAAFITYAVRKRFPPKQTVPIEPVRYSYHSLGLKPSGGSSKLTDSPVNSSTNKPAL
jgi:sigma-E factor negative regulatory protein RseC